MSDISKQHTNERIKLIERFYLIHQGEEDFSSLAIDVFKYQYKYNEVYRSFVQSLGVSPDMIVDYKEIPLLPISAFKTQVIKTGQWESEVIYQSSGTSGVIRSNHHIRSRQFYFDNTFEIAKSFFSADISEYCFLALLPSYMDREGSSLIEMVSQFIEKSKYDTSGFYHGRQDELIKVMLNNELKSLPTILWGVSYALLDLIEVNSLKLCHTIIIETGGMKGRRKELAKEELHKTLCEGFGVDKIYSEYGMTELLSQSYSSGSGIFHMPATMRIVTKEITDVLSSQKIGKRGQVGIIDLANIDTCSFVLTDDIAKVNFDSTFELYGRIDNSDIRGCNLLLEP